MDETFGLPAFFWKIAQGGDVLLSVIVVLGIIAEIVLMVWAFRTILRVLRKRREERMERDLGDVRERFSRTGL